MNCCSIYTVNAFTDRTFTGNPAAVCLVQKNKPLSDDTCQKIAFELNLSETAFVVPMDKKDSFRDSSRFGLRWFTPAAEVPLCGHATLSTAHILFTALGNQNPTLHFETLSGELICRRLVADDEVSIQMDFPETPSKSLDHSEMGIFDAVVKECVGNLPVHEVCYCSVGKKLVIVLDGSVHRKQLESLKPNPDRLVQCGLQADRMQGVCVTLKGNGVTNGCVDENTGAPYDFVSRYFAPWVGIAEDPVTGSLHCALGPYWSKVLSKTKLHARQCSRRGGTLDLELGGDGRVIIRGKAVTVIQGNISF